MQTCFFDHVTFTLTHITWILEHDLDVLKMYLYTKNELSMSRLSKVRAKTVRHTHVTNNITTMVTFTDGKNMKLKQNCTMECGGLWSNSAEHWHLVYNGMWSRCRWRCRRLQDQITARNLCQLFYALQCFTTHNFNPLKGSGIRWLHFKVFNAIQI